MDCSPVFDNVKYEKAKAHARYDRYRKISRILQVVEVVVAVALISWSSTRLPGVLKLSGGALVEFGRYVCNTHVVFLIGNAIVAVLFLFRRVHEPAAAAEGEEDSVPAASDDIYDEYVRLRDRKPFVPVPTPVAEDFGGGGGAAEEAVEEKQIVCVFEEKKAEAEQCAAVAEAIETATRQIERFQRTQSGKLKREIAAAAGKPSPPELRRSETVKIGGRRREEGIKTVPVDRVEKLSDEEFNMTIEAYIKRHRESISSGDEITTKPSG